MERRNDSSTLTSLLYEGSGESYVTTDTSENITNDAYTTPLYNWTNGVKSRYASTQGDQFDSHSTTYSMATEEASSSDGYGLSQTNIFLIAVLVVCFATLVSVIIMCFCLFRRRCKYDRRFLQSSIQPCSHKTTLVSKTTSITGLNVAHEYYSTKVEKKHDFPPSIIGEDRCDKNTSTAGELGAERIADSSQSVLLSSPACRISAEDVTPVYFKMKNVLTSTPAISVSQQTYREIDSVASLSADDDCTVTSPASPEGIMSTVASPQSIYTSALSSQPMPLQRDSLASPHYERSNKGEDDSSQPPGHSLKKESLTQSISWFVPLDGNQREPIRHSVVELFPEELSIEQVQQHAGSAQPARRGRGVRAKKYLPRREDNLHENGEETEICAAKHDLQLSELSASNSNVSNAMFEEDVPLINCEKNIANSLPTKRSRLKSTMSEDRSANDDAASSNGRTRSRSLSSPGGNSMWKQREERPVLFLGSGIE